MGEPSWAERHAKAAEIMRMVLPPGSKALHLGRLGFGPWAMTPKERRAATARERAEKKQSGP